MSFPRRAATIAATFATVLAAAGSAPAATVAEPTVAEPAGCPEETLLQPYLLYLDTGWYFIAPGGHFEPADEAWELAGGAHLQGKARINDFGGEQVLRLPAGASATSPEVCIDVTRPHMRFDVRAHRVLTHMKVEAVRRDGSVVHLRRFLALGSSLVWDVSPKVPLTEPLGIDGDETERVRLRITSLGGTWDVDDVAVDPYKRG